MSGKKYKYATVWTSRFKKDYKKAMSRNLDMDLIDDVIDLIAEGTNQKRLTDEYSDYPLTGNWRGFRECHILPDWLLIYRLEEDILVLSLARTGKHNELLGGCVVSENGPFGILCWGRVGGKMGDRCLGSGKDGERRW